MVKEGNLEEPLVLLFVWGYYLTMEGCSLDWAKKATDTYINDKKYIIVLGTGSLGNKSMTIHGWHLIGIKTLVNSFQTQTRRDQKSKWGIVFEGSLKIDKEAHKNKKVRSRL